MKCVCLQAMSVVYGRCYDEIGPFNDTKYIVGMLERVLHSRYFMCACNFFVSPCNDLWMNGVRFVGKLVL